MAENPSPDVPVGGPSSGGGGGLPGWATVAITVAAVLLVAVLASLVGAVRNDATTEPPADGGWAPYVPDAWEEWRDWWDDRPDAPPGWWDRDREPWGDGPRWRIDEDELRAWCEDLLERAPEALELDPGLCRDLSD